MDNENIHNNSFEELCAAHVLNALDKEDRQRFDEMLKEADKAQLQLFHELQSVSSQLAFTIDSKTPSPAVKEQLMEQIRSMDKSSDETDKGHRSNRFNFAIAAAFALFIISIALIFYSFNLNDSLHDKEQIIAQQQEQIVELKNAVQYREELLSILSARTLDMVVMTGLEVNTDGYGKVIWDPEKERALLQVSNLPREPAGKDYQLWLIKNNKPMPAGVFSINTTGEASFFKIEEMPNVSEQVTKAFAITLEPEGGMPQPTGPMYLIGSAK